MKKHTMVPLFMPFLLLGSSSVSAYASPIPASVPDHSSRILVPKVNRTEAARLYVTVGLTPRHQAQLNLLLKQLYNPASPQFGHYITAAKFRSRFGPSTTEIQAVEQALRARGMTIESVSRNGLLLDVSGTRATAMNVFGTASETNIHESSAWAMPLNIRRWITGVAGLHASMEVQHLVWRATQPTGGSLDIGPYGGYTPKQIQTAYHYTSVYGQLQGRGQTIAIVTSGNVQSGDLSTFDSRFGIPSPTLTQVPIDGSVTQSDSETTLDTEWAHAIAPTAAIRVYEAATPSDADFTDALNRIASENTARVVTTSWGGAESQSDPSTMNAEHAIFEEMAAQGQSMFAAAGDDGSSDGTSQATVDYPSSDSYVTACGGTTLRLDALGNRLSETAWSHGGGGKSRVYGRPSWQYGPGVPAGGARLTSDLSLDADPNTGYDFYYQGQWQVGGGTSFVAPEMAATFALIDQSRAIRGKPSIGLADPGIYALGRSGSYANLVYHDITLGSNGAYRAGTGWDAPTGWGSINAYYFIHGLNG